MAVGILESNCALTLLAQTVTWETTEAGTIGNIGSFAERIERLTGIYPLIEEVTSIAGCTYSSRCISFTERICSSSTNNAISIADGIARETSAAISIRNIVFAERIDWYTDVIRIEVVPR